MFTIKQNTPPICWTYYRRWNQGTACMDFKCITTSPELISSRLLLTLLLSDLRMMSTITSTLRVFILGHLRLYMQGFKDVSAFYRNLWERLPYRLHTK